MAQPVCRLQLHKDIWQYVASEQVAMCLEMTLKGFHMRCKLVQRALVQAGTKWNTNLWVMIALYPRG